jgi:hypothetical protein
MITIENLGKISFTSGRASMGTRDLTNIHDMEVTPGSYTVELLVKGDPEAGAMPAALMVVHDGHQGGLHEDWHLLKQMRTCEYRIGPLNLSEQHILPDRYEEQPKFRDSNEFVSFSDMYGVVVLNHNIRGVDIYAKIQGCECVALLVEFGTVPHGEVVWALRRTLPTMTSYSTKLRVATPESATKTLMCAVEEEYRKMRSNILRKSRREIYAEAFSITAIEQLYFVICDEEALADEDASIVNVLSTLVDAERGESRIIRTFVAWCGSQDSVNMSNSEEVLYAIRDFCNEADKWSIEGR